MTLSEFLDEWHNDAPTVRVMTSGSTGKPKPMLAEKKRMAASARATCRFLGLERGDTALLCMPLDFIAGKMVVVRSIVCGLHLIDIPPCSHPLKDLTEPPVFAAMVPLQVYNSMIDDHERALLMGIKHLIIGGGAVDEALGEQLRRFPNAVWSTYGMTETLSHIAMRRLSGSEASTWYTPFDNVEVSLSEDGCLVIDAPTVCRTRLTTNDIAVIDSDGRRFRIIGRKDNVICSGGLKIHIEEIEETLKQAMNVTFMITKVKDRQLGEAMVMLSLHGDSEEAKRVCREILPRHRRPRHYIEVEKLPMTATGKPARAEAMNMAEKMIGTKNNGI